MTEKNTLIISNWYVNRKSCKTTDEKATLSYYLGDTLITSIHKNQNMTISVDFSDNIIE